MMDGMSEEEVEGEDEEASRRREARQRLKKESQVAGCLQCPHLVVHSQKPVQHACLGCNMHVYFAPHSVYRCN